MFRTKRSLIAATLTAALTLTNTLPAGAGVKIVFSLENPTKFQSLLGFGLSVFRDNLDTAGMQISEVLNGKGAINVLVKLDNTYQTASADVEEWVNTALAFGIMDPGTYYEARTGTDPNDANPDITLRLPETFLKGDVWFDPSGVKRNAAVPADKLDFVTVVLHEMLHGLGFNGFRRDLPTQVGAFPDGKKSTFDHYSDWGKPGLSGIPPDRIAFYGPYAKQQHGGPVLITGGDGGYYHLGNPKGADALADDLMSGATYSDVGRRKSISLLDLAILRDLGWQPIYRLKEDFNKTTDFDQLKPVTGVGGPATVDPEKLKKKP